MTSRLFAGGPATIVLSSSESTNFPHSPSPASIICPLPSYLHGFPPPTPNCRLCPVLDFPTIQKDPPLKVPSFTLSPAATLPEPPQAQPKGTAPEKSPQDLKCVPLHQVVSPS